MTESGPKSMPADLLRAQTRNSPAAPNEPIAQRFQLSKPVGEGAMAVVYHATDNATGQHVAIKLLKTERIKDRDAMERFKVEVSAIQRSSHPHLVSFVDAGVHDGKPFMAMEWVAGPSLKTWVDERGPLQPELALKLCSQLARGLAAMHREGILHRDVKPHNVLVALEQEQPKLAKLSDFGFAKIPAVRRLTRVGDFVGTAAYMAPEQVVQDPLDGRVDIYGLGATLYYALTGQVLFTGAVASVFLHHLHTAPAPPSKLLPNLSVGIDQLVLTMLRKHPQNRYRSTLAVAADINNLLRQTSLRGIPLSVDPDRYKPTSDGGREAMAVFNELRAKLHAVGVD